jgi:ribonucleotide monophosphatase NagD (HAD superfamily)
LNKFWNGITVCIDYDSLIRNNVKFLNNGIDYFVKYKIPFFLLSWRSNITTKKFINEIKSNKINESNVILPHYALKNKLEEYKKNKNLILIGGIDNEIHDIMKEYNFNNYITSYEVSKIFPEMFPYYYYLKKDMSFLEKVENRTLFNLKKFYPIKGIIQLSKITNWSIDLQLFSDLLISPNGIPGTVRKKEQKQYVDYHLFESNTLDIKKNIKENIIIDNGLFFPFLNHIYTRKFNTKIQFIDYSKNSNLIFDYLNKKVKKRIYLITSDIKLMRNFNQGVKI